MNSQTITNWLQILTGLALLIGIALVIVELRQAREMAMAQLTSDSFGLRVEDTAALYGEQASDVLAKACSAPESLTDGDWLVLSARYKNYIAVLDRARVIEQRYGLYEEQVLNNLGGVLFADMFSTAPGRGWWKTTSHYLPEVGLLGDAILEAAGPPDCQQVFDSYRSETSKYLN